VNLDSSSRPANGYGRFPGERKSVNDSLKPAEAGRLTNLFPIQHKARSPAARRTVRAARSGPRPRRQSMSPPSSESSGEAEASVAAIIFKAQADSPPSGLTL